jgi:4-hydroxy-3-methylbut-2-enyl diphosphate reductase
MRSLPKDVDVVLVLGSPRSNNSAKLKEIAESQGYETHFVLNVEELKRIDLSGKRKAALASGASTSPEAMEAALAYLESL